MNCFGLHRKSAWHCFLIVLGCWMFTLAWSPVAKAQTCVTANLSSVVGTTCDIGSLDFTFGSLVAIGGPTYTASDFTFTPISNGFTLSFDGGPQSITAPTNGSAEETFYLQYSAVDTAGNFTGESATGGTLTATGINSQSYNFSDSFYEGYLCNAGSCASEVYGYNQTYQDYGNQYYDNIEDQLSGSPFSNGSPGYAYPFYLYAEYGATASWDGTPTTFTFDTVSTTPEPTTMLLFATGLLGIILVNRKKLFA